MFPEAPDKTGSKRPVSRIGTAVLGVGLVAVLLAGAALVWSSVATASARIAGSTTNERSLLTAAVVDLVIDDGAPNATSGLLVATDGLYPGLVLERCVVLTYRGSLDDVPVRLFGRQGEGTGLEQFVRADVEIGSGDSSDCADFASRATVFGGTLGELWSEHDSFERGIDLIPAAVDESSVTARFSVEVRSDDAAQGLTTEFWLMVEARP